MELWRRRATGTLAEIQGSRALAGDLGSRALRFRGDLGRELNHDHPRGAEIVAAFVRGINAYIELTARESSRLPREFQILGIKPGRWTPEIVISRHNGLDRNVTQEVQLAQLVGLLGSARARDLLNLHPGHPKLEPDNALALPLISDAIIDGYKSSRAPVRFRPEDVPSVYRDRAERLGNGREGITLAAVTAPLSESSPSDGDPDALGSNNWVIAGTRTFSRGAILANDPHRALLVPSRRGPS